MSNLNSLLNPESSYESSLRLQAARSPSSTTTSPTEKTSESSATAVELRPPQRAEVVIRAHEPHPDCPDTLACLPDTDGRPQHTLPVILRCTILGSPRKRLTIREIYAAMERKYPYYKTAGPAWKQSVRHHLSLNRLFERQPRPPSDPGFGSYWTVNLDAPPGTKRPRKRGGRTSKNDAELGIIHGLGPISPNTIIPMHVQPISFPVISGPPPPQPPSSATPSTTSTVMLSSPNSASSPSGATPASVRPPPPPSPMTHPPAPDDRPRHHPPPNPHPHPQHISRLPYYRDYSPPLQHPHVHAQSPQTHQPSPPPHFQPHPPHTHSQPLSHPHSHPHPHSVQPPHTSSLPPHSQPPPPPSHSHSLTHPLSQPQPPPPSYGHTPSRSNSHPPPPPPPSHPHAHSQPPPHPHPHPPPHHPHQHPHQHPSPHINTHPQSVSTIAKLRPVDSRSFSQTSTLRNRRLYDDDDDDEMDWEDDPDGPQYSDDDYSSSDDMPYKYDPRSHHRGPNSYSGSSHRSYSGSQGQPGRSVLHGAFSSYTAMDHADSTIERLKMEMTGLRRQSQDAVNASLRLSDQLNASQEEAARAKAALKVAENMLEEEARRRLQAEKTKEEEVLRRRAAEDALRQFQAQQAQRKPTSYSRS